MTDTVDILIKDLSPDVANRLSSQADYIGMSRVEYIRRLLTVQSRQPLVDAVSIHPGFAADAAADEFTAEPTLTTRACIENGKGQAVYVSEVRIWADSHLSGVMRTHDGNLYEERGKGLRYINFATQLPFQPYESATVTFTQEGVNRLTGIVNHDRRAIVFTSPTDTADLLVKPDITVPDFGP